MKPNYVDRMIRKITPPFLFLCTIAIVFWIVSSANKEFTDYTEKCIHGHIMILSHSGGIAGPIGKCDE